MDSVITLLDPYVFDPMYERVGLPQPFVSHDHWVRQLISTYLILFVGAYLMYFTGAGFSWYFFFDKNLRKDKRWLKNQELLEMGYSARAMPVMAIPMSLIFLAEIRGYSQLHENPIHGVSGWMGVAAQILAFLAFTDMLIYFIHRGLHLPWLYVRFHKPHHKWIVTSPFSSHAFHPLDGFAQALPYHIYVFMFPMNKWVYLSLFVLVNYWTISIHDGLGVYSGEVLNGSDHHVIHHRQFNYNYGQYFTLWDKLLGTHRKPTPKNLFAAEPPRGVKEE
ncbi:lathosterol oxidase [Planoprotostelium fungivorum]|uniref:Lathosterol oxidase n=1 Tax=Planoprotostelium fungivorum TaxID=1890364 RepID=A0A2P6NGT3_9EUKA|nr:lathosterol oxidase [Planoprotostelium fungivorum]